MQVAPSLRNAVIALGGLCLAACGGPGEDQIFVGQAAGGAAPYALDFDALSSSSLGDAPDMGYCRQYPSRC